MLFRFVLDTCRRLKEKKSYMVYTAVGCLGVSALSDLVKEVLELFMYCSFGFILQKAFFLHQFVKQNKAFCETSWHLESWVELKNRV